MAALGMHLEVRTNPNPKVKGLPCILAYAALNKHATDIAFYLIPSLRRQQTRCQPSALDPGFRV